MFSTFPGAWPGIGLLLLRVALGATAITQGIVYLADGGASTPWGQVAASLGVASGGLLLIGFLTPIAAVLVALGASAIGFAWFPAPAWDLFDAKLPTVLVVAIALAIVFLGPGGVSLDARLFGRREIIIPQSSRQPED